MTWFPIGPDFIYAPRDAAAPDRLSRRNMYPRQAYVGGIVVDPTNSSRIYTIEVHTSGSPIVQGAAVAHRTENLGKSWTSITDILHQSDFTIVPTCIAIHPSSTNYVYLGTSAGKIYVSSDYGKTWPTSATVSIYSVNQIVVDPRNAANPLTTTIYAATGSGLFVSTNGGTSWGTTPVLAGLVSTLAFSLLSTGAHCYAGVWQAGIYYSTNPSSSTAWSAATGNTLPATGTFDNVYVQLCPANPQCAYAYFYGNNAGPVALCNTTKGGMNWKKVNANNFPTQVGPFAVAPNSTGQGGNGDILFLGHLRLSRSTDGGANWTNAAEDYHDDQRSFAFDPPNAPPGTIPTMYIGCDGGLVASTGYADPNYAYGTAPTDFDDGATYNATSGVVQNLNQGKVSAAVNAYNADPSVSAVGYIVSDDTGLAGHTSALGWRGLVNADGEQVACTPTSGGMTIWAVTGWPFWTTMFTDTGVPGNLPTTFCKYGGNLFLSSSNHVLSLGKTCLAGIMLDQNANPKTGPVVEIDATGTATQISQVFSPNVEVVAASPIDAQHLACITRDASEATDQLFVTKGVALNSTTVWKQAATNQPSGIIASVAIDHAGNVYALMQTAVGGTPLFSIANNTWTAVTCTGLPGLPYGKLVADPATNGKLYAVSGNRVFRIVIATNATWTEVGTGLPGTHVEDLWIGQIPEGKVLLRATIAARGVWEHDVTANASDPPARPYMRDHFLDQGWVAPSPEGLVNPFNIGAGKSVWWWMSEDIKVDSQQSAGFFQSDPEGNPLTNVLFDVLRDNSLALPSADTAKVHVQVHNRSLNPISTNVWALYTSASAGVPALDETTTANQTFPFWQQFLPTGGISNTIPSNARWQPIGAPIPLSGIDALHPQVASWDWQVPTLMTGDNGHYCIVAFVHSGTNPINETGLTVDAIVGKNPQIAQKNLHVLPTGPGPMMFHRWREYIEFHNSEREGRVADLVFDLRHLPPELHMFLRLSALETVAPLEKSLEGIETVHHPGIADAAKALLLAGIERGEEMLEWLERWLDHDHDHEHHHHKRTPVLRMTPPIYRAKPSSLVAVRNVRLPTRGIAAAVMAIQTRGHLPPGREYRFDVHQVVRGVVVGGSTYVVRR